MTDSRLDCSYVLPLRMRGDEPWRPELSRYLQRLADWCAEVIVVDGSPPAVFGENASAWGQSVRHVPVAPGRVTLMGKVGGVLTGVELASFEHVVVADDDVRYELNDLRRVVELLDEHDLVRPQNYFDPRPWHALWDTSRTLLNRSVGADFPGTLALRRSRLLGAGGYDGSVLFENLELIRTIEAHGGRIASPLGLYVRRLPPSAGHFWGQRTRQAYDDFAQPARMALWLGIVPLLGGSLLSRRPGPTVAAAALSVLMAERGRRRCGGAALYPAVSSLLAPLWLTERGLCAWLALLQRLRLGGVRYGDSIIRVAAHSTRELRLRAAADGAADPA